MKNDAANALRAMGFAPHRRAKHSTLYRHPTGATASLPLTPSDHRSTRNSLADARRAIRAIHQ